jgi:dihydrofolate synthase/folylpolyglutamate synthase
MQGVKPSLLGPHQLKNAALALKATAILRQHGIRLSKRAAREGMVATHWPGRFQVVPRRGRPTLVFDVGHNAGGVAAFVEAFQARFPGRRTRVLTGFVKRKEHQKIFDSLAKIADDYSLVPLSTKRTVDVAQLCREINWRGVPLKRYGTLRTAWKRLSESSDPDDIITVIGSHYLVGEFFRKFGRS